MQNGIKSTISYENANVTWRQQLKISKELSMWANSPLEHKLAG
jgi:hypothetical protein